MVLIAPISLPIEDLMYTSENVQLKIDTKIIGSGTIYIRESCLSWQPVSAPHGISIPWKHIGVHAKASDPKKCIYLTLNHKLIWPGPYEADVAGNGHANLNNEQMNQQDANDDDEGNASDEGDSAGTECWFVPTDASVVDALYLRMCDCQALHPDSNDSVSEESDFDMNSIDEDNDDDADLGPMNDANDVRHAQGSMRNLSLEDNRFADAD
ncbi:methylosome subunit pICln [Teleopsis dalmanni]|uniref:methylosome subunit pICln-like n=1 Tax=Teleopsis dalmanni TaxID=139649 RepID=UPI0018CDE2AB|nr:methylosome subunit pICln-like [Teleopsis dalmanni]XP_037949095.1 methylosome subunit pICln [Teleopsis dalmanni]